MSQILERALSKSPARQEPGERSRTSFDNNLDRQAQQMAAHQRLQQAIDALEKNQDKPAEKASNVSPALLLRNSIMSNNDKIAVSLMVGLIFGASIIALSIAYSKHYIMTTPSEGLSYIVNNFTGVVTICDKTGCGQLQNIGDIPHR